MDWHSGLSFKTACVPPWSVLIHSHLRIHEFVIQLRHFGFSIPPKNRNFLHYPDQTKNRQPESRSICVQWYSQIILSCFSLGREWMYSCLVSYSYPISYKSMNFTTFNSWTTQLIVKMKFNKRNVSEIMQNPFMNVKITPTQLMKWVSNCLGVEILKSLKYGMTISI